MNDEPIHRSEPPFDGNPRPCCPLAIRNLIAVATKIANGSGDVCMDDLRRAVKLVQPLVDKHFADRMHSHGQLR